MCWIQPSHTIHTLQKCDRPSTSFPTKSILVRFYQKFDLVPKLSLRVQLEGLNINKKYRVLTSASLQRAAFQPFFHVSDSLECTINDTLSRKQLSGLI
jgi:hypothetical protein